MNDLMELMPHSKTESKMRRGDSLFSANEMAEMKNCNKCVLFEGRRKRDLYMWVADVARGPSAKFQVENVHTKGELKLTGNCLKGSRPLLSFDLAFSSPDKPHLMILKELFVQTFGIPKGHPRSQPFYDRVYTFSVVDDKVWFRHYQVLPEEDGSLAEIGPRFVLNPIKIFDASFSGQTLWENPRYVTPAATRSLMKKMKAGKYLRHVESKAAYEASRPKESTYKVDKTDDVFATLPSDSEEETFADQNNGEQMEAKKKAVKKPAKKNKLRRKKMKMATATAE
jgi:ribosome biogenesis protein BRX1